MDGLYTIVEFDENDKWFVAAENIIDNVKYDSSQSLNAALILSAG